MSKEALERAIDRVWHDGEYWMRLQEWPNEVQDEYSLTDDEVDALKSSDLNRLRALGVGEGHLERVPDQPMPVLGRASELTEEISE